MTKHELIVKVAGETDTSAKQTKIMMDAIIATITEEVAMHNNIAIFGLGKFKCYKTKERTGRNPKTGEKIIIKPKWIVRFKAEKSIRTSMNPNLEKKQ